MIVVCGYIVRYYILFLFLKQNATYEVRISYLSSDVCSSDLSVLPSADRPSAARDGPQRSGRTFADRALSGGPCRIHGPAPRQPSPLCYVHRRRPASGVQRRANVDVPGRNPADAQQSMGIRRSEEHTSELQSLMRISYAVFCLNKKKKIN